MRQSSRRSLAGPVVVLLTGLLGASCGGGQAVPDGGGGGGGTTGAGGAGGQGGGAGSACVAATMLDRACATVADCAAVLHETNCCGGLAWLGIRASEKPSFTSLEGACTQSYPPCGCFDGRISADDGSQLPMNATPPVTCVGGLCQTYHAGCGQPCPSGTSCMPCSNDAGMTPSCVAGCPIIQ